jgi:cytochrome c oxidase subunit 3
MSTHAEATTALPSKPGGNFHVAHHFDSADEQFDSGRMGVWIFLVTEILFFGGLFCAFAVFRAWYFDAFVSAHHHLDKKLGALNTIVLIFSSLTMALAVRASQMSKPKLAGKLLLATLACAAIFLVVKYFEYSHKFHDGLLPGKYYKGPGTQDEGLFFAVYFMMTGVHGLHVVVGMGLIFWIWLRNRRLEFGSHHYAAVEGVGLYWHLVDLVWIYLFPLLYLIG